MHFVKYTTNKKVYYALWPVPIQN